MTESVAASSTRSSPRRGRLAAAFRSPAAVLGLVITGAIILVCILGPGLTPHDPNFINYQSIAQPPDATHWLGTDSVGRDVLSRLIVGARVSFIVGISAVALSVLLGVAMGSLAGLGGKVVDGAIMRVVDVFLAFPTVIMAIAIVAVLGSGTRNVILALALHGWTQYARVVRAEIMAKRELEYVEAARALGARQSRVALRHLLPNIAGPVIVLATLDTGTMIIAEAGLSFLGLGIQPPSSSWGTILADGRAFLRQAPHITTFAGLTIMLSVLGLNLLGNALGRGLNPRAP